MAKPNDWICLADDDLRAAKSLIKDSILGPAIYHTQQCAEKALKGYLASKGQPVKRTHDLLILVADCTKFNSEFNNLIMHAVELNPYVSKSRYPEDCLLVPDITTVTRAIILAEEILNFVQQKIEEGARSSVG